MGDIAKDYQRFLTNRLPQGKPRSEQKKANRRRKRIVRIVAYFCLPIVLCIRLLRPLLHVRFGYVYRHKIGHCPLEAEFYLLEKAAGLQPRLTLDLFYFSHGTDGLSANLFAEALVRRHIRVYPWVEYLATANEMLPNAAAHIVRIGFRDDNGFADTHAVLRRFPQQINLNAAEEKLGRAELARMGVPEGAGFICFHVRDRSYWGTRKPGIDDTSDFRNSDIENYYDAMRAAVARGYYVLRIGAGTAKPLPALGSQVIDYTNRFRTEFMDVYLAARCSILLSTGSGIDSISYLCRRSLVMANYVNWGWTFDNVPQPYLSIIKQFRQNGRVMTMSEVVAQGAQDFVTNQEYVAAGIELEQNSPGEIANMLVEMIDRIEGKTIVTAGDTALQERMRAYIARSVRFRDWQFEVSLSFLRKHQSLL